MLMVGLVQAAVVCDALFQVAEVSGNFSDLLRLIALSVLR